MDDRTIIALLDEIERLSARVAALEGLVKLEEERSDALGASIGVGTRVEVLR